MYCKLIWSTLCTRFRFQTFINEVVLSKYLPNADFMDLISTFRRRSDFKSRVIRWCNMFQYLIEWNFIMWQWDRLSYIKAGNRMDMWARDCFQNTTDLMKKSFSHSWQFQPIEKFCDFNQFQNRKALSISHFNDATLRCYSNR